MRINWRRFWTVFGLLQVALFVCGCTAAWLGAVSALLPSLEAAVSAVIALVMGLEGKTVPVSTSAAIQKIGSDIAAEITQVQTLIADFKASASTGLLSQIQAVLQGILTNLADILSGANVVDSATVSKITALVGLAVAAAQAIIGLVPLVAKAMTSGASDAVLEAQDKEAAAHIGNVHKGLQEAYSVIRNTPTESADVNTALESLPAQLP